MKRLILTTTCTLILAANAFGDGLINFVNSNPFAVTLSSNGVNLGPTPGLLGQFKYELFVAPAATMDPLQFVATGVQGTNTANPGRFIGGNNLSVPGVPPAAIRSILVRGWSTSLGDDYDTAFSLWNAGAGGFLGETEIAPQFRFGGDAGDGFYPPSPPFGGNIGIQHALVLSTVPEPSAIVLAGLGIGSLILSRRHNRKS